MSLQYNISIIDQAINKCCLRPSSTPTPTITPTLSLTPVTPTMSLTPVTPTITPSEEFVTSCTLTIDSFATTITQPAWQILPILVDDTYNIFYNGRKVDSLTISAPFSNPTNNNDPGSGVINFTFQDYYNTNKLASYILNPIKNGVIPCGYPNVNVFNNYCVGRLGDPYMTLEEYTNFANAASSTYIDTISNFAAPYSLMVSFTRAGETYSATTTPQPLVYDSLRFGRTNLVLNSQNIGSYLGGPMTHGYVVSGDMVVTEKLNGFIQIAINGAYTNNIGISRISEWSTTNPNLNLGIYGSYCVHIDPVYSVV